MSINNEKILVRENKTLSIRNSISKRININDEQGYEKAVYMLQNYIKANNLITTGPIILHSEIYTSNLNNVSIYLEIILQIEQSSIEKTLDYDFVPAFKISNCLFCRFSGEQKDMQFAQNKLGVIAYENDIKLKSESYTIYLKQENNEIIADIFIPTEESKRNENI